MARDDTGKLLHQKGTGLFDEDFFPDSRWSPFDAKQVDYTVDELPSKGTSNPRHVTQLKGQTIIPIHETWVEEAIREGAVRVNA